MTQDMRSVAEDVYVGFKAAGFIDKQSRHYKKALNPKVQKFLNESHKMVGISVQSIGLGAKGVLCINITHGTKGSQSNMINLIREIYSKEIEVEVTNVRGLNINLKDKAFTSVNGNHYLGNRGVVRCGSSCAPSNESYSGTFGAIMKDEQGNLFILSNNHVLAACNHKQIGTPIISPSSPDSGPDMEPVTIASLDRIVALSSMHPDHGDANKLDIALAKCVDEKLISSWQGDNHRGFDTPSEWERPEVGMLVKKFGRTTGLTFGVITQEIVNPMPIWVESILFSGVVYVDSAWAVKSTELEEPFSSGGDSGSLVVSQDNKKAIGLIFAGNGQISYIIPMGAIIKAFDLALVSNHNLDKLNAVELSTNEG